VSRQAAFGEQQPTRCCVIEGLIWHSEGDLGMDEHACPVPENWCHRGSHHADAPEPPPPRMGPHPKGLHELSVSIGSWQLAWSTAPSIACAWPWTRARGLRRSPWIAPGGLGARDQSSNWC
jgi:hypothetical protein